MSFFQKLLLGIAGAEIINDLEDLHERRAREREQQRHDSLFWQDAAMRGSSAWDDEEENDW